MTGEEEYEVYNGKIPLRQMKRDLKNYSLLESTLFVKGFFNQTSFEDTRCSYLLMSYKSSPVK